jgi:tRNA threonylcarbamoyladenosine biosynthesis protein TsaE
MHLVLELPQETDTQAVGAVLAGIVRPGDILALQGPLGAGKSTLARSLIQTIAGQAISVPSPTYTLVQVYDHLTPPVWHFDLYRLNAAEEVWDLGIEEAFAEGVSLIEWPERLGATMPKTALWCKLESLEQGRQLTFTCEQASDDWAERLDQLNRCFSRIPQRAF